MNRISTLKVLFVLVVILISLPLIGAGKGPTDYAANRADAVVVGEVKSGPQTGNSLVLTIVRTIKGELSPGAAIGISTSTSACQSQATAGQFGLWYLSKTGSQWAPLPPGTNNSKMPCWVALSKNGSPAGMNSAAISLNYSDRIAIEIVTSLLADARPLNLHILGSKLQEIEDSTVLPELYRQLRGNPDLDLRFLGLIGLLRGPQGTSALAEIADNVELIPKSRTGICPAIWGIRNSDPAAVRSLGRIAVSPDPGVQGCAAAALSFIHTQETLPFLATLLDSNEPQTRTWAVWGFSKFVNNIPIVPPNPNIPGTGLGPQGPTPYRTPETDKHSPGAHAGTVDAAGDVQFWKLWWAGTKGKLSATNP